MSNDQASRRTRRSPHASRACTPCRQRKKKCLPGQSSDCERCFKNGLECVFSLDGRTTKARRLLSSGKAAMMDGIERVSTCESNTTGPHPSSPASQPPSAPELLNPGSHDLNQMLSYSEPEHSLRLQSGAIPLLGALQLYRHDQMNEEEPQQGRTSRNFTTEIHLAFATMDRPQQPRPHQVDARYPGHRWQSVPNASRPTLRHSQISFNIQGTNDENESSNLFDAAVNLTHPSHPPSADSYHSQLQSVHESYNHAPSFELFTLDPSMIYLTQTTGGIAPEEFSNLSAIM